jgi:hypothetical protein
MKSDDRCAVALTEVAPGEIATVRKLEHLEITHRARLPAMRSPVEACRPADMGLSCRIRGWIRGCTPPCS